MQNFISTFSPSKSFQFVTEQLSREKESPRRHDCHDPPHAPRVGRQDDRSPPRRLAAVARSDPWKTTPAQAGFCQDATRRRRLPWVVGSDRWNTGRGGDYLRRDRRGEDCHPEQEICVLARLRAAKIELEAFAFDSKQVETYPLEEVNVKLFELLPFLDLPGQCTLTIAPPIDLMVKQALARLESRPSRLWLDAVRDMETGQAVRLEVSLEELALLLERVDFSSSRLEDIEAMKFWTHLQASCELLEALGHEWSNHLGFDCQESFTLAWCVPEGMVGYLAWLARSARPVPTVPEQLRYVDPRRKLAEVATRLLNTLTAHVNAMV